MVKHLLDKINKTYVSNLILWIIATLFIVLLKGYRFIWSDQAVYFLNPMRLANSSFITNDWLTWQTTHLHIAFTYYSLLLLKLGHFQTIVFLNYLIFSFLLAVSLWLLTDEIIPHSKYKYLIYLTALIILISSQFKSIGDTFFKSYLFLAQDMSWPFLILSTVYLFKDKYFMSGLMLGIAGLLHFNFLVVGLAVTFIFFCLQYKGSNIFLLVKRFALLIFTACAVASPAIYVAVSQFLSIGKSDTEIFGVLFTRNAHHFIPSAWPLTQVLNYVILNLAGMFCLHFIAKKEKKESYKNIYKYYLSVFVLFFFAFIFVELYPSTFVTRLFLWRIAPILTIISTIFLASLLVNCCFSNNNKNKILTFILLLFFWIEIKSAIFLVLSLLLLFLFIQSMKEIAIRSNINQIIVFVIVLLLLWVGPLGFIKKQIMLRPWMKKHVKQLYKFVKKETARREVFMIPPMDGELCSFRIMAKRAIFIDYKAVPYRADEIKEWKRRMDLLGNNEMDYYRLKPSQIVEISRKYNISYFITDRRFLENILDFKRSGMNLVFNRSNNPYVMYRVAP